MGEIVKGPWGDKVRVDPPEEYVDTRIDDLADDLSMVLFDQIDHAMQCSVENMDITFYLAMINESIRSVLYKIQNHHHPYQTIADNLFVWSDGVLCMRTVIPSINFEE